MDSETIIEIISTVLSIVGAIASLIFAFLSSRETKRNRKMAVHNIKADFYSDLRSWANQVIQVMTEGADLCELDPELLPDSAFFFRWHGVLTNVSSLFDQGRFFIPNIKHESYGTNKPAAYRGIRQESLDLIDEFFKVLLTLNFKCKSNNKEKKGSLIEKKKKFVSEIQKIIELREMIADMKKFEKD